MDIKTKIAFGGDHAGFELKSKLIEHFRDRFDIKDFGCYTENSVDYPDFVHPLAMSVANNQYAFGILICGSGNGVCMTANKHQQIRAALCWDTELGSLARQHNDANILCLPARFISEQKAIEITEAFLTTAFEGGRHNNRVKKIPLI
ncbi:MAG: ribose 5-phosphate isomerase B [Flavobacteriales bacterium]|nr:ribose 5-phosphate isomerase B [Flavobacteriales bacterium]